MDNKEILKDIKKIKNTKNHDALIKKYKLMSQKDYLIQLIKIKEKSISKK